MAMACCSALAASQTFSVLLPNTLAYNQTEQSYWSIQEASLIPTCIAQPQTAQQTASIVTTLISNQACSSTDFAIKCHGHAPAAGFANIGDGGVTIDLSKLNSIFTNADHSVASVGAGASWLDVYTALDPVGKSVAGGRNGAVGVGGLTLGGGISYFSPQVGWTCDTLVNVEVVLADGSLVDANASSNADLFRALKGGTNNFGLVTRFDYATVNIGEILGGSVVNGITQRGAVFEAFANIADAEHYDVHASIVMGIAFNSSEKAWSVSTTPIYTLPEMRPAVYDELFSVPNISDTLSLTKLHTFANETPIPQLNWQFWTGTYGVSAQLLDKIFDIANATLYDFEVPGSVFWDISFEPLPTVFLAPGAGKNSLGTSPAQGNEMIILISVASPNSDSNGAVHAKGAEVLTKINQLAKQMGLLRRYVYANYADWSQNPIASYGRTNVKFLHQTAQKYDPKGIFQTKVPGGFKVGV